MNCVSVACTSSSNSGTSLARSTNWIVFIKPTEDFLSFLVPFPFFYYNNIYFLFAEKNDGMVFLGLLVNSFQENHHTGKSWRGVGQRQKWLMMSG